MGNREIKFKLIDAGKELLVSLLIITWLGSQVWATWYVTKCVGRLLLLNYPLATCFSAGIIGFTVAYNLLSVS